MLNTAQTRIIDPILSTIAQGYKNSELVGAALFPPVPVDISGGQIIEFGREDFKLYNMRRAPGANARRLNFGYLGKPFALVQDSVDGMLPREYVRDASVVPGIDLGRIAVTKSMRAVSLTLEADQAAMATNAANYDAQHKVALSAGAKWSSSGTPMSDIDNGREAIRATVGVYPNTLLLSAVAFNACKNNASITSRFQYTSHSSITAEMLAALFNVERVVVGKAISFNDANVSTDIWGNNAILAYTNLGTADAAEPSFGYTYTMRGHPNAAQPYWDNSARSWGYPVDYERVPVFSGITAGYLIQTPA